MIKINLLKQTKKTGNSYFLGIDVAAIDKKSILLSALFFMAIGPVKQFFEQELNGHKKQLETMQNKVKEIDEKIKKNFSIKKQLEDYERDYKDLELRQKQILSIIKMRENPTDFLEKMAKKLPDDIWFNEISFGPAKKIVIKGLAKSFKSIGIYRNDINQAFPLKNPISLKNWETKKIQKEGSELSVQSFELIGELERISAQ